LGTNIGMKFFENRECFIFRAQKIDPSEMRIVINKSDEVFVISMGYKPVQSPIYHYESYQKANLPLIYELEMVEFYFSQVCKNCNQIEQH